MSDFVCPITKKVFCDPLLYSDGYMYEKEAMAIWQKSSEESPMTGENIDYDGFICIDFNNDLAKYIETLEDKSVIYKPSGYTSLIYDMQISNTDALSKLEKFPEELITPNNMVDIFKNLDVLAPKIESFNVMCGTNPLIYIMIDYYDAEWVQYILERGADPNVESEEGDTPLCFACYIKGDKIINVLIKYGAKLDQCRTCDGYYPIHIAAMVGDVEVAKCLKGSDLSWKTKDGETPLDIAKSKGDVEMIKYLSS